MSANYRDVSELLSSEAKLPDRAPPGRDGDSRASGTDLFFVIERFAVGTDLDF
jgi:hypothetical protein